MKICVAQTRPVKGDIQKNIEKHRQFIDIAIANSAGMIVFPELSLTGYEPKLGKELAFTQHDDRLEVFQTISNASQITIGVGAPTKTEAGTCISMLIFQPQQTVQVYSKMHLHADESPYFVSGKNIAVLTVNYTHIALAICYEISIPEHAEDAFKNGATIYLTSVAKTADGVEKAASTLSGLAKKYSMTVLMSNSIGPSDDFVSGGNTAAWNNQGLLAGQLNDTDEGLIILDTDSNEIIEKSFRN